MSNFSIEIPLKYRYLHFPIRNGSPRVTLQIWIAGQVAREFSVELAENEPVDWWAFYDVSAFTGQNIQLIALEDLPGSAGRLAIGSHSAV